MRNLWDQPNQPKTHFFTLIWFSSFSFNWKSNQSIEQMCKHSLLCTLIALRFSFYFFVVFRWRMLNAKTTERWRRFAIGHITMKNISTTYTIQNKCDKCTKCQTYIFWLLGLGCVKLFLFYFFSSSYSIDYRSGIETSRRKVQMGRGDSNTYIENSKN